MKFISILFMISLLSTSVFAKENSIESVFKANKVKLLKTDSVQGEKVYYVELPFDPSVGRNTVRLEAEIAAANNCKSFQMVSELDGVQIKVKAHKDKKECVLKEDISPLAKP